MARIVVGYATSWRLVVIGLLAAGLAMATLLDQRPVQLIGVVIAALAVLTLLAQLDHGLSRVARFRPPAEASAHASPDLPSRRIGTSSAIASVVLAGKNKAPYARDCIESLKAQTLANFEAVIIDDCSTDSTLDIVLDAIADDTRFRVIRTNRPIGINLARNQGVHVATGKYVTFLDLDDFLAPDALATLVELAEEHADMPWVGGAYCWHDPVSAEATRATWRPRPAGRSPGAISWIGSDDAIFSMSSAPMLRREAFVAVGGFDDSSTVEDAAVWFKLLRWGFVFLGTGTVGIAHRREPALHAVATAVQSRDTITRLLTARTEAAAPPGEVAGPYFFKDSLARYRVALGFTHRTAAALGIAVASGAPKEHLDGLVEDLRSVPPPLVGWMTDLRALAWNASKRVTRPRGETGRERAIGREIDELIGPLIAEARRGAAAWRDGTARSVIPTGDVTGRPVRSPFLMPISPASLPSLVSNGRPFLLLPSAAYHTDELIDLVDELRRRGFAPLAMLTKGRWATTGLALARADVTVVKALPPADWLHQFDALLTFNDWGEYFGRYVVHAKGTDTVSFAKVEGVQDWDDVDTGLARNPYQTADVVLCQGENDLRALQSRRGRLEVVGSARLQAIWDEPLPADVEPRVVGNVNFTYGVQIEHREMWVRTLEEACRRADVPLDLSLHPSEAEKYPGRASPEPIRHLMTVDSILVSRFSTVLWEGMARGCSVIYYNPHGERVAAFQDPQGAFDVATDADMLVRHIQASKSRSRAEAKKRGAMAFERQVSMERGQSVAHRTVEAIERNL